jgi:hypothetical protein
MNSSLQLTSVRRLMSLAGAIVLLAGAGAAMAQEEKPLKGSFDQPLQPEEDTQAEGGSNVMISEADGQHTYSVKIENGKVISADVDGKKIPKSRVHNKNGKVEILDADGNVVKTFNVQAMGGAGGNGMNWNMAPGGNFQMQPRGQGQAQAGGQGGGQGNVISGMVTPPVMMGITMSDPGEGEGVMVDSVLDGLPADKAGVEVGDRITAVDGKKIEGQQALRDVLKEKKAGDTVELKLDRDGNSKTVKVKLAKFDAVKLHLDQGQGMAMGQNGWPDHSDAHQAIEEAKKTIQKAIDDLAANENLKPEKIKAKANDALRAAMDALEKAKDQVSSSMDELHSNLMKQFQDGQQQWKIYSDGGKGSTFVVPGAQAESGVSKQLDKLSEQIEKLNKRLDQIEKDRK